MEMRQELNDQKILIPNEISFDRLMMIIVKEQRSIRNFLPQFQTLDIWLVKISEKGLSIKEFLKIQTKSSFFHLFDQQIKHENPFNQRSV